RRYETGCRRRPAVGVVDRLNLSLLVRPQSRTGPLRLTHVESALIVLGSGSARQCDRAGARSVRVECGFTSDRAPNIKMAHEFVAKPLTPRVKPEGMLWWFMRGKRCAGKRNVRYRRCRNTCRGGRASASAARAAGKKCAGRRSD